MKIAGIALLFLAALCLLALAVPVSSGAQSVPARDVSRIKTADFGWMTGRWIGHLQNATAEQICSTPQSGEMLCLFRVFVNDHPAMYELYTLSDTPRGPELRSLHFPADLAQKSLQEPLILNLEKYTDKEVVFTGAPGTQVVSSSLFRESPVTMNGVIMFADQKQPHIRVRWERVAYDAQIDYSPQTGVKP